MGNERGRTAVYMGGKRYVLVFDFSAIAEINERFGNKTLDELFFNGTPSHLAVQEAVRVGLRRLHPKDATAQKVSNKLSKMLIEDQEQESWRALLQGLYKALAEAQGLKDKDVELLVRMLDPDEDDEEMNEKEVEAAREALGNSHTASTGESLSSSAVSSTSPLTNFGG